MRPADLAEAAELLADAFVEDTNLASFVPARGRRAGTVGSAGAGHVLPRLVG